MEGQNASSHPILPAGFANPAFASTFSGITSPAGNVSNPIFMSTLQQLQGLSAGSAALLPGAPQLTLSGQFASDFNNLASMGWSAQNATWLEQAKVAAILPMYGVLSATGVKTSELPVESNCLTPPVRADSVQSACGSLPLAAASSFTSSGIFPLNPIGVSGGDPVESSPRTSVTPQRNHKTSKTLAYCSPGHPLSVDIQPSSMQSHHGSVGECRPSSSSALSSQDPSSVSAHSHNDSLDISSAPQPNSVPPPASVAGTTSAEIICSAPGSTPAPSSSNCPVVDGRRSSSSHPPSVEASTPVPTPGSQNSGIQQHAPYDLTLASQHPSSHHQQTPQIMSTMPSTSSNTVNNVSTSSGSALVQDFPVSVADRRSPESAPENVLDTGNLEDLPWSSIDLGDLDLFGGASAAEKDVMHSVLDMDPSVMHRILTNDASGSASQAVESVKSRKSPAAMVPSTSSVSVQSSSCFFPSQIVTPKIREKIKMRREKELADADKELDRLLSLVAKKDAGTALKPKMSVAIPVFNPLLFNESSASDGKDINLSPVQFTPPDSPSASTSGISNNTSKSSFFFPPLTPGISTNNSDKASTSQKPQSCSPAAPFLFMPAIEKKTKFNKIPVYKRKTKSFLRAEVSEEDDRKPVIGDAYSFTDDDDEESPLPSGASVTDAQIKEQRLAAEVAQKLAKINNAHPELRGKNAGYDAQSQQDLWRHVVPKKRHSAAITERPSIPSTPLLPPAAFIDQKAEPGTSAQKPQKVLSLAETLRLRKQRRSSYGFLKTKLLTDKDTAKNEYPTKPVVIEIKSEPVDESRSENGSSLPDYRPLPKLLIRLPRRSLDASPQHSDKRNKKKKKRKKKDRDREWEGSDRKKKRKKHKHRHRNKDKRYESHLLTNDDTLWRSTEQSTCHVSDVTMFSKKRRLMMQWNNGEEQYCAENGGTEDIGLYSLQNHDATDRRRCCAEEDAWNMPSKFSQAHGRLPKGTFVVSKVDILKKDCPIWRVDNQNLLQKYPPFDFGSKLAYRNSSTYSGWCDQIADGYLVVEVQFIKHTRSESIIEPALPLTDMFPAVSMDCVEEPMLKLDDNANECENDVMNKDPIRCQFVTYIRALLNHGLTLTFLQSIKQGNDWNYLHALSDIDKLNIERKEKLKASVKWVERFVEMLHFYSSCACCEAEKCGLSCQACGTRTVEKVVQLFANEGYDYETLEPEEMRYTGSGSPMPAVEYLVCQTCAKLSLTYHKLHHMRYILFQKCEDRIETVCSNNSDLSSEQVVETCMRSSKWINSIASEYMEIWRKIELDDF